MTLEQIVDRLQKYIAEQPAAARLPSGRKLSELWEADFSTLNRAIAKLVERGILRREGYKLYIALPPANKFEVPSAIHVLSDQAKLIEGASEMASLYNVKVISAGWNWISYRSHLRKLLKEKCGGIIVRSFPANPIDDLLRHFSSVGIPAVTLLGRSPHAHSVEMDEEAGGRVIVSHLLELGHREIACWDSDEYPTRCVDGYRAACLSHGLGESVDRVIRIRMSETVAHNALAKLRAEHPHVTALFITSTLFARKVLTMVQPTLSIPKEISIAAYGAPDDAGELISFLTVAEQEPRLMGRYAAGLLLDQYARKLGMKPVQFFEHLRIEPKLVVRHSTASPQSSNIAVPVRAVSAVEASSSAQRITRDRPPLSPDYDAARSVPANRFAPLNLRPLANQSLTRFNGWLGQQPLLLKKVSGERILGVPFDLIDEKSNQGHAAIVLRSEHIHHEKAPASIDIPVNDHAQSVYFLHGCGWVTDHVAFAEYRLLYEDGTEAALPLIPYGAGPHDAALVEPWLRESNIQDWWPSFIQFTNETARHFMVTKDDDPEKYERYLYTLEWVNPHPERMISALRVTSRSLAKVTLCLLAVTVLRPGL